MGEYADMMLDGTMCSQCGEFLGGDEGYPVACAGCEGAAPTRTRSKKPGKGCPTCQDRFPTNNDRRKHMRDAHGLKFAKDGSGKLVPVTPPTESQKVGAA